MMHEGCFLHTRLSKILKVVIDQKTQSFVSKYAAEPLKRLAKLLKHLAKLLEHPRELLKNSAKLLRL